MSGIHAVLSFPLSFFWPYKELSAAGWGQEAQHCTLSAVTLPTLFVFTGNPTNPSRKKDSAHTTEHQAQKSPQEIQGEKSSKLN